MQYFHKNMVVILLAYLSATATFAQQRRLANNSLSSKEFERAYHFVSRAEAYRDCAGASCTYSIDIVHKRQQEPQSTKHVVFYQQVLLNNTSAKTKKSVLIKVQKDRAVAVLLGKGSSLWFYKDGAAHAFRISPAQTLLGHVTYAEIMYTNYLQFYDPVDLELTLIENQQAYKVTLAKIDPAAVYSTITLYISDDEFNKPMKAELYNEQTLNKTIHFVRKNLDGDATHIQKWRIVDEKHAEEETLIYFGQSKRLSLPQSTFTPEGMKGL